MKKQKQYRKNEKKAETFPHFRPYKKSGHPALILGEEKDDYRFRRVTSSEKSGHHRNEKIVKQQQTDKKIYFGKRYPWKLPKK